jgi:hypothetical protein
MKEARIGWWRAEVRQRCRRWTEKAMAACMPNPAKKICAHRPRH